MLNSIHTSKRVVVMGVTVIAVIVLAAFLASAGGRAASRRTFFHFQQVAAALMTSPGSSLGQAADAKVLQQAAKDSNTSNANSTTSNPTLDLTPSQLNSIKIEPVGTYAVPG